MILKEKYFFKNSRCYYHAISTKIFENMLHYDANLSWAKFVENAIVINTINEIILALKIYMKRKGHLGHCTQKLNNYFLLNKN